MVRLKTYTPPAFNCDGVSGKINQVSNNSNVAPWLFRFFITLEKHFIMARSFLTASTLLMISSALAQQPIFNVAYGTTGNEMFRSAIQTSDGGFIAAGETSGIGNGNLDIFVVKTDSLGDTLWTSKLGGSNSDQAASVQEVTPGKYLVTGYTRSFGAGDYDVYLALLGSTGDTIFTRTYGDANPQYIVANSAKSEKTYEGGYILAATAYDSGFASMHIYLIKTDSAGNQLWAKSYYGSGVERAWAISRTIDTTYLVTGITTSNASGNADVFLMKIDGNGNIIWCKTYGSPGGDEGVSLTVAGNGDCIIYGTSTALNSLGYSEILILRTDVNGNPLWSNIYSSPGDITYAGCGIVDIYGNLILSGSIRTFSNDYSGLALKTDPSGNLIWARQFTGPGIYDSYNSVGLCFDGTYIFSGITDSYGTGYIDGLLSRIGPNGETACSYNAPSITVTPVTLTVSTFAPQSVNLGYASGTASGRFYQCNVIPICSSHVGVTEPLEENVLNVFPNPVSRNLYISLDNAAAYPNERYTVWLLDNAGRVILNQLFTGNSSVIDLSSVSPGMYQLRIENATATYNKQIIVE